MPSRNAFDQTINLATDRQFAAANLFGEQTNNCTLCSRGFCTDGARNPRRRPCMGCPEKCTRIICGQESGLAELGVGRDAFIRQLELCPKHRRRRCSFVQYARLPIQRLCLRLMESRGDISIEAALLSPQDGPRSAQPWNVRRNEVVSSFEIMQSSRIDVGSCSVQLAMLTCRRRWAFGLLFLLSTICRLAFRFLFFELSKTRRVE